MNRHERNEVLTRTGPATPAGKLLRRYWQPVALADELAGPRPIKAVRLLGEDFVLFRDELGRAGLLQRHCPHRCADLAYGRVENSGLRCAFHGWLFDVEGRCLETPAEPEGSRLHERVRARAHPVVERSGILFAWLGDGEPTAFPDFDCFVAPESHTFAFKGYWDCNWLQALEVGIDPAHASFLHRFFEDEATSAAYGRQFRDVSLESELPMTKLLREYQRPEIKVEETEYGMRLLALRHMEDARTHVRVTNLLFPQAFIIPMSAEMTITQWHVPTDDTGNYWYAIFTSFGKPVDKQAMREQRLKTYPAPDYRPVVNRANYWGFDPEEQRTQTFTGMGFDINVHDQWACESQGLIHDRTREHLGTTDKGVVIYRRMLLEAIGKNDSGETPRMVLTPAMARALTGPAAVDAVVPSERVEDQCKLLDARRREQAPWARAKATV